MAELTPQQRVQTALQAVKDIGATRQKKQDVLTQLGVATNYERDVRSRITALDKSEVDAMSEWAAAGAKGTAPVLDHAARASLNRELGDAQAQSQAAQKAAQTVQGAIADLNQQIAAAFAMHKIESLAYLATFADALGAEYRQARIQVEKSRAMLLALARFFADNQSQEDQRTTAFLPIVQPHINQRDFYIEKVQSEAMQAATQHWQQLWAQCMRGELKDAAA